MNEALAGLWMDLVSRKNVSWMQRAERGFLSLTSFFYGSAVRLRNFAYDKNVLPSFKAGVPVISIGNLSMGGSGKTPLTLWCIEKILKTGERPAVLTRGYKGGDEAGMISSKSGKEVPVIVDADRVAGARKAISEFHPACLLLDDGFQHRRIRRDLDILCLEPKTLKAPFLFPRGFL